MAVNISSYRPVCQVRLREPLVMLNALVSPRCRKLAGRHSGSEVLAVTGRLRSHLCDAWKVAASISSLCYVAVAVLAASVYWTGVDGQFVHDDIVAIVKNDDVKPDTSFTDILHHDFWGRSISSERSHKSYRPLCVVTFRLGSPHCRLRHRKNT